MARQVKRDHPEVLVDFFIAQLMAPFAAVGPGRVQAHHGYPFAGLLIVNPVFLALVGTQI